ncbi:eukaryotic translation initiation factor 6-2-like protein [Tanacetum coccineum]
MFIKVLKLLKKVQPKRCGHSSPPDSGSTSVCIKYKQMGNEESMRHMFENLCEIGVFSKLTNAYCLVAIGGSDNIYSTFESELTDVVHVVNNSRDKGNVLVSEGR